ncbi:acylneuraminate cytidylyltransferase [Cellulomonas sp. SLBN-39]|uniref:acylneuraminate cytidylyltransferase n=1 Tax=Cellulomonas sp. SLBN-39 TaxID=2768446 RepID=UPI001154CACE|nr:acylneuraminate cytidylyltransferase [Cellulomonas sp. SLBN-39]TQL03653.1 N-acylneuraminate cytidylyltransferase [Cellulomonas sp. SLBN-39]
MHESGRSAPRTVVVVPARGGSQGVPLKNLRRVGGRSLLARAVTTSLAAPSVDLVVVSTDHAQIAEEARLSGARVVHRPADLAGDTATSESAVLHALDALAADGIVPEVTVLVQATSPFIDPAALERAVRRVLDGHDDAVLAAAPTHAFTWRDDAGRAVAVGHDASHRPRRQDREPLYRETGDFYVMRTAGLREAGHRFFGRTALEIVAEEAAVEIDSLLDLAVAQALAAHVDAAGTLDVDAVVTDFDGVHTDDHALVDGSGREFVRVHRGDGLGVGHLRDAGIPLLILSKERDAAVGARAHKLGVEVQQGVDDKASALRVWLRQNRLDPRRVAYVGNDINDLPAMELVGWPVAVADARPEVLAAARVVLASSGGHGAVREVADRVLRARGSRS